MKLYFDSCLYGRHRDNQKDARVAAETIAIMTIVKAEPIARHTIWGSTFVTGELNKIKDDERRADVMGFYCDTVDELIECGGEARAQIFQAAGLGPTDSAHLAAAEAAGVDYLLTVDDDFERIATEKELSRVRVINPLTFLAGGSEWSH